MIAHLLSLILLAFAVSLDGFGVGVTYGLRKIRIPFLSIFIIACCSGLVIWLSMQAGGWLGGFLSETAAKFIGAAILIGIGCWALIQLGLNKGNDEGAAAATADGTNVEAKAATESGATASAGAGTEPGTKTAAGAVTEAGAGSANTAEGAFSAPMQVMKVELKRLGLVIQILRKPQVADVDRSGSISASEAVMLGVALSIDAFGAGLGAALLGLPALLTAVVIAVSSAFFLVSGTYVGLRFAARRSRHALSVLPGILLIMMGIMKML
ncbi:manganese efflux pump [Paenibacillus sp. CAU 1782]